MTAGSAPDNARGGSGVEPDGPMPDRPYKAVYEDGQAPETTHVLERSPDGTFTGYAVCGAAPDGWVGSLSGKVSCGRCRAAAASTRAGKRRP